MKIKKGDNVKIITGKDKGKTGKVDRVFVDRQKVVISGLNLSKSHERPRKSGQKGQIIEKSMPIHVSNVMIIDPKGNKPTRIGSKLVDGKRKRIAQKSKTLLD